MSKPTSMNKTNETKKSFIYVLYHFRFLRNGSEENKLIGVYKNRQPANNAIKRLKRKQGFINSQDGFYIDKLALNKTYWRDGFVTVEEIKETIVWNSKIKYSNNH